MFKLKTLVAAVSLAALAGASQAAVLVIDDFNIPGVAVTDADPAVGGGYVTLFGGVQNITAPTNLATSRLIEHNWHSTQGIPNQVTNVTVGGGANGVLTVNNDAGVDSDAKVTWAIAPFALPPGPASLFFQVIFSNLGTPSVPIDLSFNFTGGSNWSKLAAIPSGVNFPVSFALNGAEAAAIAGGGTLTVELTGSPAWEITLDSFGLEIPEPASLALAGLALIGAGVASRRRKAA